MQALPAAASVLLAPLLDTPGPSTAPGRALYEAARTPVSVWYATGHPRAPWLCLCTAAAVRLPCAVLVDTLPGGGLRWAGPAFSDGTRRWRVSRWWRPPQPAGLPAPAEVDVVEPAVTGLDGQAVRSLDAERLVGAGPGLTPAGDDVLAAAVVTMRATGDARFADLRGRIRRALSRRRTTCVSAAMLDAALGGYCCPELDRYLRASCTGVDCAAATRDLLAVGHSSGAALRAGVHAALADESAARGAA